MSKPAFDPNQPFQPAAPAGGGKPAFDPNQAYEPTNPGTQEPSSLLGTAKKVGAGALDLGLRGLDYAGGLTRTAAAGAISPLTPNGEVVGFDDVKNAFKGRAPGTAEYMDRMGIPEGAHVDLNPFMEGDTSARDIGGFIGDVALDPLTYATFGGGAAVKEGVGKALTPVGRALETAGDGLYKSGFKTVDAKLARKGVEPLSEVMLANGRPQGTAAKMSEEVQKLIDQKMADRKAIYDAVAAKGGTVDVAEAARPAVDRAREIMRVDPNAGEQVASMEQWLRNYGRDGQHIPIDLASDYKSRIYNASLPANAYDPFGRANPVATEMKQQFARGLKEGIENAAEKAEPGLGAQITKINSEMSPLIVSQEKILPTEVMKSANKNGFTSVDAMIAGLHGNPITAIPMLAMKKAADGFNTTAGRTSVGNMLSRIGREGTADAYARRALIDENQSPWVSMQEKKK